MYFRYIVSGTYTTFLLQDRNYIEANVSCSKFPKPKDCPHITNFHGECLASRKLCSLT